MAAIIETPQWEDEIRAVSIGDPVAGGDSGPVNLSIQDLANRTLFLKNRLAEITGTLAELDNLVDGVNVSDALMKAKNLADIPNKVTARSNLGVSAADHTHDTSYLKIAGNLSDLDDSDVARDALRAAAVDHTHDALYILRKQLIGVVLPFAMKEPPAGFLVCNGALVSRIIYADLFAVIGTLYGAGDGSTTFRLPDARGEFLRGWDNGRGIDSGRSFGSTQSDAIRNIKGTLLARRPDSATADAQYIDEGDDVLITRTNVSSTLGSLAFKTGNFPGASSIVFDASKVVPTAAENRPHNLAIQYCICCG